MVFAKRSAAAWRILCKILPPTVVTLAIIRSVPQHSESGQHKNYHDSYEVTYDMRQRLRCRLTWRLNRAWWRGVSTSSVDWSVRLPCSSSCDLKQSDQPCNGFLSVDFSHKERSAICAYSSLESRRDSSFGSLLGAWLGADIAARLTSRTRYRVLAALLVVIAVVLLGIVWTVVSRYYAKSDSFLSSWPQDRQRKL